MSYVDDNLMPGEAVTYRAHLHWVIYLRAVVIAVFGIAFVAAGFVWPSVNGLAVIGAVLLVVAAVVWIAQWVKARTSEFAITNKRVIIKVGLVRRDTLELLLTKVESIGVDQTVMGRVIGYGSIVVVGTGGTREPFKDIARPLDFRKQVQAQALA